MANSGGQRYQPTIISPSKGSAERGGEDALRLSAEEEVRACWRALSKMNVSNIRK